VLAACVMSDGLHGRQYPVTSTRSDMRVFRPEFHTAALGRDFLDPEVGCSGSAGNSFTQLYNLDAVAYESVLVGLFSIFTGKECGTMCNVTGQHCSPYNRTGMCAGGNNGIDHNKN
jgi:hypothetical protein